MNGPELEPQHMLTRPLVSAEQHLDPVTRDAMRTSLLAQISATRPGARTTRRRKIALTGIAATLVVAGGGTATAYQIFGSKPVTDRDTARCYSKISTDFGRNFPGTEMGSPTASDGTGGEVVAPVADCAEAWRIGVVQGISPLQAQPPYPVPHLVGCVLPNGSAAVFPGADGTCQRLGLPTARSG